MILYIHGFNSTGTSETVQKIKNFFGEDNVIAPTLPPSPKEGIKILEDAYSSLVSAGNDVTVIGNSLGGFYALYLHHLNDCRTILINPSINPFRTLEKEVGKQKNYITGEEYEFKKEYINELEDIYSQYQFVDQLSCLLHIFYSKNDELINHTSTTLKRYPYAKTITMCPTSTHRFENLETYLPYFGKIMHSEYEWFFSKKPIV